MAKTYLELMVNNQGFKMEDLTEETKEFFRKSVISAGFNPDDEIDAKAIGFEPFTCSICGKEITDEFSNNAQPVNDGRCCGYCNRTVVIPARLKEAGYN